MRRKRYVLLFGSTLAALITLAGWWSIYFLRAARHEHQSHVEALVHEAKLAALRVGFGALPAVPGALRERPDLVLVPPRGAPGHAAAAARAHLALAVPAGPGHAGWSVAPSAQAVAQITTQAQRRRRMFIGEGSLLFALLGVCTGMLLFLTRQDRRLIRRMEAFVSSVSHEMKTPLAGIKSMLQTLGAGRVPPDQVERLYAMGLKETHRLEHMVENVLLAGRLRAAHHELSLQPLALQGALESFLQHRRRYLVGRAEELELAWDAQAPDLAVQADADALRVILDNLTDNALKYGGDTPRVRIHVQQANGTVQVAVEDQGIGFEPERARDLFSPFRRDLNGHHRVHHGTGLGLSIARELSRQMGGDLVAESAGPGQGSRFTISLKESRA